MISVEVGISDYSILKKKHLNLLLIVFDRFVVKRTGDMQMNFHKVWDYLCDMPCLILLQLDLNYLPEFFIDEETLDLDVHMPPVFRFKFDVLSFSKVKNVLDFGHQAFVGFSQKPTSRLDPQLAC